MTERARALEQEDGAVLILTAFIFIALLAIAALVIDIVVIHQAELKAQSTADATVLAAALDLDDVESAVTIAKDYAARNYGVTDGDWDGCVDPEGLAVKTSVNCITVDDEDEPELIRVRIPDRSVPSFFATVLGYDGFDVSATAVAQVEYIAVGGGGGHGVNPFEDCVRDGFSGGWVTTAPGDSNYVEDEDQRIGCPENFWEDYPAIDDGDVGDKKKKKSKEWSEWREYIFVFEHTNGDVVVWCDTNRNGKYEGLIGIHGNEIGGAKETALPGNSEPPNGSDVVAPYNLALAHVSCSGNWLSGWSTKDHPTAEEDPEWRVIFYRLDKRTGDGQELGQDFLPCESNFFGAVNAEPPDFEPIIRLYD